MATVDSMEQCTQCGSIAMYTSFYTRTSEWRCGCFVCGHTEGTVLVRDDDGEPVLSESGALQYRIYDSPGRGAWEVKQEGKIGTTIGFFDEDDPEEQLSELKSMLTEGQSFVFVSIVLGGELIIIVDNRKDFCPKCHSYGTLTPTDTEGMTYECDRCGHYISLWENMEVGG